MGYWKQQLIIEDENRFRRYSVPEHGEKYFCLSHFSSGAIKI